MKNNIKNKKESILFMLRDTDFSVGELDEDFNIATYKEKDNHYIIYTAYNEHNISEILKRVRNIEKYEEDILSLFEYMKCNKSTHRCINNEKIKDIIHVLIDMFPNRINRDMIYDDYYIEYKELKRIIDKKPEWIDLTFLHNIMNDNNLLCALFEYKEKLIPILGLDKMRTTIASLVNSQNTEIKYKFHDLLRKDDRNFMLVDFNKIRLIYSCFNDIYKDITQMTSHKDIFKYNTSSCFAIYHILIAKYREDIFDPDVFDWTNLSEYIIVYKPSLFRKYKDHIDLTKHEASIKENYDVIT